MPTVYKTAADRTKKSARWMVAWTDELGHRRTRRGYTDKALSERLARQLEDAARARREGTIDAAAERMADHSRRPLADHVADYRVYLAAKGSTEEHVDLTEARIEQAAKNADWKTIADIDAATLSLHVERVRANGRGHATINHHLRAVKGFTRWLMTNHRLARDPLVGVKMLNVSTDRRRERRALDDDELARLLAAAAASESVTITKRYRRKVGPKKGEIRLGSRTFTIPQRDVLYLLAASTGFRFGEIKSLTTRSFDLDADPPTVTVEASYSKRRRRDVQPLRPDIADGLRATLDATPRGEHVWPSLPDEMAQVIAADLAAAGIAVRDDAGRVIDFHALRHTFITRLARSGVTPKVAQTLARHSTITLTMDRYAHVALADTSKALASLPALPLANSVAAEAAVAATGTHGREVAQRVGSAGRSAHGLMSPNGAGTGQAIALRIAPEGHQESQRRQQRAGGNPGHSASSPANDTSTAKRTAAASEGRRNSRKRRDLCAPGHAVSSAAHAEVSSEADGTRTRNHRIDRGTLPEPETRKPRYGRGFRIASDAALGAFCGRFRGGARCAPRYECVRSHASLSLSRCSSRHVLNESRSMRRSRPSFPLVRNRPSPAAFDTLALAFPRSIPETSSSSSLAAAVTVIHASGLISTMPEAGKTLARSRSSPLGPRRACSASTAVIGRLPTDQMSPGFTPTESTAAWSAAMSRFADAATPAASGRARP
ncbi:MAG TPA: site-specific integrase [Phycisphaerales bacterium]|nr:site-specific integrase [Phycisphaerales bacterium]